MSTFLNPIEYPDAIDSNPAWHEGDAAGLRYRIDSGKGGAGARTIVLIHELGGSIESWDGATAGLDPAARVIRYDQRGQGRSALPHRPYSVADHVDDLRDLLDALATDEPLWLVAAAAGAAIAVTFAARYASRVEGLVLCAPALDVDPQRRHYLLERAERARTEGMHAIVDGTLANSWPVVLRSDMHAFDRYRERFIAQQANGYAQASEALSEIDLSSALASLACPCLFLAGEFDVQRPPQRVAAQAKQVHGADFATVPQAGHLMAVQQPAEVAARIDRFIKENSR